MPFKSKAQRRKFAQLLVEGKISPETYEEWNRETGGAKLPERAGQKRRAKAAPKKPKRTAKTKKATVGTARKATKKRTRRAKTARR
jgi:hypothetical protein